MSKKISPITVYLDKWEHRLADGIPEVIKMYDVDSEKYDIIGFILLALGYKNQDFEGRFWPDEIGKAVPYLTETPEDEIFVTNTDLTIALVDINDSHTLDINSKKYQIEQLLSSTPLTVVWR